jgi:hypothetical protein
LYDPEVVAFSDRIVGGPVRIALRGRLRLDGHYNGFRLILWFRQEDGQIQLWAGKAAISRLRAVLEVSRVSAASQQLAVESKGIHPQLAGLHIYQSFRVYGKVLEAHFEVQV